MVKRRRKRSTKRYYGRVQPLGKPKAKSHEVLLTKAEFQRAKKRRNK